MKFQLLAVFSLIAMASPRPIVCPDAKRDAILRGDLPKEACCSYGKCLGDVVIASS